MRLSTASRVFLGVLGLVLTATMGSADRPRIYCIEGATVVPGPGERLDDATVVFRDGLIEAVGKDIAAPADAVVIDGEGLWVYPGLIDPVVSFTEKPAKDDGSARKTTPTGPIHPISRIHPEEKASDRLGPFSGEGGKKAGRLRELGFTTVGTIPSAGVLRGTGAAVLLADDRPVSEIILRDDVAQHIGYEHGSYGGSYPTSLMGAVAAIRQTLLDTQRHAEWLERYERNPLGMERPDHVAAFAALGPLVTADQPALFHAASTDDVLLSARLADEFDLSAAILGPGFEWETAEQIKATGRTMIIAVAWPKKPEVATDEEALDVTLKTMRRYLGAPANAARLEMAGIRFALTTNGLEKLDVFKTNMARMLEEGLSEDAALAALTTVPAELMGIDAVVGTLESGKIANIAIFDGPIFAKETAAKRLFVDGLEYRINAEKKPEKDTTDEDAEPADVAVAAIEVRVRDPQGSWLFTDATVWTQGPRGIVNDADVLISDGLIVEIGIDLDRPRGATVIDAAGMHITPGLIDVHSHLAQRGGTNEGSNIVTAETRISDIITPDDVNIYRQLGGGLTSSHLLHGSANAIGGQDVVIKLKRGATAEELVITGRQGIKFALGENPKRSNMGNRRGATPRYPKTRMGVIEAIRRSFTAARNYQRGWQAYESLWAAEQASTAPPRRDLQLETVLEVLEGDRDIHCHAYRQDEMLAMMRLAEDFGIRVRTFEHGLEGYKIASEIAAHGAGVTTQSDWWGYKLEAFDATPYNGALLTQRGVSVSFSSDSNELARRLNLEAAKAVKFGALGEEEALATVTSNAAEQLRLDHRIGSLEPGMDADLVLWSGHPLSVYAIAEQTWVDGVREFDRTEDLAHAEEVREHRAAMVAAIRGPEADEATDEATNETDNEETPPAARPPARALSYEDRLAELGGTVSIIGATIHTVAGETITDGTVSFSEGRIVELGAGLQPLPDAEIIDATGKHVFPGLIDGNSVVGLTEISSVAASVDIAEMGNLNPALSTAIAVNPDSSVIPVTRANGVTHSLTVPTGGLVSGSSTLIRLDGWTWEDLRAAAPVAVHIQWPAFTPTRSWFGPPKTIDELAKERKQKLEELERLLDGARAYATAKTAGGDIDIDPQLEAMLPVLDGAIPVIVHAEGLRQINAAVAWAEKEKLRLILAGRKDMWRAAEMLAEKKIPVIVTNILALPGREDEPYDTAYATAARLHEAGVDICIAGSANSFSASNARNLPDQAAMAAAFGLPREAALESITLAPARILGVGKELGSIEIGKSASLIITDGDVLEIRTTVERVFIDGREADLSTRQTRLWERYARRPAMN